jgi:hypothetical protein
MPGAEAFIDAMGPVYDVNAGGSYTSDSVDYNGRLYRNNRHIYVGAMAKLVPICGAGIWTDTAAAALVGTKEVLGPGNTTGQNILPILVTPTASEIKYHWSYAIPAFIAALIILLIAIVAVITLLFGHNSIARLHLHLQRLSPGRIFTTFLTPEEPDGMTMKSSDWAKVAGKAMIDLSGECPRDFGVIGVRDKSPVVSDKKQSPITGHSEEVEEEEEEDGNGTDQEDSPGDRERFSED